MSDPDGKSCVNPAYRTRRADLLGLDPPGQGGRAMVPMIGLILLMGLVTKNAILVVDFANVQRRAGLSRTEAVIGAARVRLRPILMTTLAMIFGMLPLAFEWGAGAEFRAPMARAVIGGLITSTLLTLVVVPVVYTYLDDVSGLFVRWWRRGTPAHARVEESVAR